MLNPKIIGFSFILYFGFWANLSCAQTQDDGDLYVFYDRTYAEQVATESNPIIVRPGKVVVDINIGPEKAAKSDADFETLAGEPILEKGTELKGYQSEKFGEVYCTFVDNFTADHMHFKNRSICLIDQDSNGIFERFIVIPNKGNWYNDSDLKFSFRSKSYPLKTGVYHSIDPKTSEYSNYMGLFYDKISYLRSDFILEMCYTNKLNAFRGAWCLKQIFGLDKKDVPGVFDVFGGQFKIVSSNDGELTIQIVKPIPRQLFSVRSAK